MTRDYNYRVKAYYYRAFITLVRLGCHECKAHCQLEYNLRVIAYCYIVGRARLSKAGRKTVNITVGLAV